MRANLISMCHLMLMDEVDGNAAERFYQHVKPMTGNFEDIGEKYDLDTQLRWLSQYWVQQLANRDDCVPNHSSDLIGCRSMSEYVDVFREAVIPYIRSNHHLPNLSLSIKPMEQATYGNSSQGRRGRDPQVH